MSGDANSGSTGQVPAGWYDEPTGGPGRRWWDGTNWTSHTQQDLEPVAAPTIAPSNPVNPQVLGQQQPLPVAQRVGDGVEDSRAAWWIAFSPLWSIVGQAIVVSTILALTSAQIAQFVPGLVILNVVLWAAVLALAFVDRARLRSGGNATTASPFWVLLSPLVYLIARAREVQMYAAGAWTVVIWWCVALVLAPGLAVLGVFAAYGIFAV
ncbi:MAG TPA: DUF2510 domain-containing protein [Galbitalea sp.]|jgi:hypothetical protein|nr:DUF2510 domain-containing protein [Galbitalea sp.]